MKALTVFSESIRYMKDTVWRRLQDAVMNLQESDLHWVLTVPAIWEDGAKQFMRVAAIEVYKTNCVHEICVYVDTGALVLIISLFVQNITVIRLNRLN